MNNQNTIYDHIFALASPVVDSYRTDFEHDRAMIENHPGTPFIYGYSECGTHLAMLRNMKQIANTPFTCTPKELKRYALQIADYAICITDGSSTSCKHFAYCDGKKVLRYSRESLHNHARMYRDKVEKFRFTEYLCQQQTA